MARPTKFNPERAGAALGLARAGEPRPRIAAGAGVGLRTLQEWLARGRAGESPFAAWSDAFDEATIDGRRPRREARYEREQVAARVRWQRFKAAREAWWRERLGPANFWQRRVEWLAAHGKRRALAQAFDTIRAERGSW